MAPASQTITETISDAVGTLRLRSEPPAESKQTSNTGTVRGDTVTTGNGVAATSNKTTTKQDKPKWYSEYAKEGDEYPYARYLPTFDGHLKLPPLTSFKHVDPGLKALDDPEPQSFLANSEYESITPDFGTEVLDGVQLSQLDDRGRQQLALFVAQRGVVVSCFFLVPSSYRFEAFEI
jgi:hypothetical protein